MKIIRLVLGVLSLALNASGVVLAKAEFICRLRGEETNEIVIAVRSVDATFKCAERFRQKGISFNDHEVQAILKPYDSLSN